LLVFLTNAALATHHNALPSRKNEGSCCTAARADYPIWGMEAPKLRDVTFLGAPYGESASQAWSSCE